MEKPILKNEIEAKINGVATVEDNIAEAKEYALQLKEYYSKLIFSENQIEEAKIERASINKIVKKISDYRKDIVAEFKKPIEIFETTAKETEKILKETADFVDIQIKNYEDKIKSSKKEEIVKIFNDLIEEKALGDLIKFDMIFDERYLNKTYDIENVEEDIADKLSQISNDIKAIKNLNSEYEVSLINNYLNTFDLSKVIVENKRLYELKEQTKISQENIKNHNQEKIEKMLQNETKSETIDPIKEYVLRIKAPLSKLKALRTFLELNNMSFEKID